MVAVAFALLPLSTDLYLASLPALRRHFEINVSQAQLTLSAFIVGFAISQLVYGPLSDRFGRRPVLIAGLAIYRRPWTRAALFALGYYVVTLLPVLGFVNIYYMMFSLVADHWQYFSLPAVVALTVGGAARLLRTRFPARPGSLRCSSLNPSWISSRPTSAERWRGSRLLSIRTARTSSARCGRPCSRFPSPRPAPTATSPARSGIPTAGCAT